MTSTMVSIICGLALFFMISTIVLFFGDMMKFRKSLSAIKRLAKKIKDNKEKRQEEIKAFLMKAIGYQPYSNELEEMVKDIHEKELAFYRSTIKILQDKNFASIENYTMYVDSLLQPYYRLTCQISANSLRETMGRRELGNETMPEPPRSHPPEPPASESLNSTPPEPPASETPLHEAMESEQEAGIHREPPESTPPEADMAQAEPKEGIAASERPVAMSLLPIPENPTNLGDNPDDEASEIADAKPEKAAEADAVGDEAKGNTPESDEPNPEGAETTQNKEVVEVAEEPSNEAAPAETMMSEGNSTEEASNTEELQLEVESYVLKVEKLEKERDRYKEALHKVFKFYMTLFGHENLTDGDYEPDRIIATVEDMMENHAQPIAAQGSGESSSSTMSDSEVKRQYDDAIGVLNQMYKEYALAFGLERAKEQKPFSLNEIKTMMAGSGFIKISEQEEVVEEM